MMTASWDVIFHEMFFGSVSTIVSLLKVLIPLMIIVEILMTYNLIDRLAKKLEGFAKVLGMSRNAIFPLLVGVIMGITYGAGTLIEINNKTPLSRKDMLLVGLFMFMCHGIIETTILFGINGASIVFVSVIRLLIAIIVTAVAARLWFFRRMDRQRDVQ